MQVVAFELNDTETRNRYDKLFSDCPNAFIQQSTQWAEVISKMGPDEPIFLLCHEEGRDLAGLPLYLYNRPSGSILTSVPQAGPLGGIFLREGLPQHIQHEIHCLLLSRSLDLARAKNCNALTIITSFLENTLAVYEEILAPTFVLENFTQYIDLQYPSHRSGGQRNNLARARNFGFSVDASKNPDLLSEWYPLHEARHRELGTTPISYSHFEGIFRILMPLDKAVLVTVRNNGKLVAGSLYIYHLRVLDVFAISMDSAYASYAPNALAADYSMRWAEQKGIRIYNWQSSPSRASGVFRNKQQWGSIEAPYYFVTRLLVEPAWLRALGIEGVRREYPGHYVAPFASFDSDFKVQLYRKP